VEVAGVEAAMNSDPGSQVTGPGGTPARRVGEHVASADRLIEQSHQAIVRIRARIQQTDRRVQRAFHRVRDAAGAALVAQRPASGAEERFLRGPSSASWPPTSVRSGGTTRRPSCRERLGHPDRATSAREHARQARTLHEQALRELYAWAGSAPATEE
jgi:hypothetical protein